MREFWPRVRRLSKAELESLPPGMSRTEAERLQEHTFRSRISKVCNRCGERKLLRDFHRLGTVKDGRRPECKQCRKGGIRQAL